MLVLRDLGLYCPAGDFYIDPKGSVDRAVITHAHSDHARRGAKEYITAASGLGLLRARLGQRTNARGIPFGEPFSLGPVRVSLHPAGHILGSAQVRMEWEGEVWVVSGDYKREPDPSCEPFESVSCDVFVTEATFGTPAFRWKKGRDLGQEIYDWWQGNAAEGYNSIVLAYSLGKTQRILGELCALPCRPVFCAPAATPLVECYRREGVELAPTLCLSSLKEGENLRGELVLGPSSLLDGGWVKLLSPYRTAFASGWVAQRRLDCDHGFVMSDHADWEDLIRTILDTGARRVYVQHRGNGALVRCLRELGIEAYPEAELGSVTAPRQMKLL